jgi:hypothetical protein
MGAGRIGRGDHDRRDLSHTRSMRGDDSRPLDAPPGPDLRADAAHNPRLFSIGL